MDATPGSLARSLSLALPLDGPPGRSLLEHLRRVMVTGAAVTVPFLVTLAVLVFVLGFVSDVLRPLVDLLGYLGVARAGRPFVGEAIAVTGIVGLVFVTGAVAESRGDTRIGTAVEALFEGLPGIGTVYTSFDRMSEVLLSSDAPSFREVKLVEFPNEGVYAIAFLTSEAPASVTTSVGEGELQVLFVPMAPNPVMGGHLVCVPAARVHDVDMTMQEAFQAIVTSGVAMGAEWS